MDTSDLLNSGDAFAIPPGLILIEFSGSYSFDMLHYLTKKKYRLVLSRRRLGRLRRPNQFEA
jgi:hypothetical protein